MKLAYVVSLEDYWQEFAWAVSIAPEIDKCTSNASYALSSTEYYITIYIDVGDDNELATMLCLSRQCSIVEE